MKTNAKKQAMKSGPIHRSKMYRAIRHSIMKYLPYMGIISHLTLNGES